MRWLTRLVTRRSPECDRKVTCGLSPSRADEEFLGYEGYSSESFASERERADSASSMKTTACAGQKTASERKKS